MGGGMPLYELLMRIDPAQLVRLEGYTVQVKEKPAGEYRTSECRNLWVEDIWIQTAKEGDKILIVIACLRARHVI